MIWKKNHVECFQYVLCTNFHWPFEAGRFFVCNKVILMKYSSMKQTKPQPLLNLKADKGTPIKTLFYYCEEYCIIVL